jgi:dipeptidyl aminopeptidase/acylaminoacyl peptidase
MQDPKWIGTLPSDPFWSIDSKYLYFKWNANPGFIEQLYKLKAKGGLPEIVTEIEKSEMPSAYGSYNKTRTKYLYEKQGDLFIADLKSGKTLQITNTSDYETNPVFSFNEDKIVYEKDNNLYFWILKTGQIVQITNFTSNDQPDGDEKALNDQDSWLKNQQLELFDVLKVRKKEREKNEQERKSNQLKRPKEFNIGEKRLFDIKLSPDEKYVVFVLYQRKRNKSTIVPNYVTESGYTENINSRAKVGSEAGTSEMKIFDILNDSIYDMPYDSIPGISDQPEYLKDTKNHSKNKSLSGIIKSPKWSDDGRNCFFEVYSNDNKDRWILLLDLSNGKVKLLERQHDNAWIGGPGIGGWGSSSGWMPDNKRIWFQSEERGYSHLYVTDIHELKKTQLTKGKFEISDPFISLDKKFWYFKSNEKHPGEQHFYKMPIEGGDRIQLTDIEGNNDVYLSPDEQHLAILFSYINQPWEIYLQENKAGTNAKRITHSLTNEFKSYQWKIPEIITFRAADNAEVYARLYKPEQNLKNNAAVLFVHGAGYLQNAHKWWSDYFHEYMFHNLLVDNGYTVLDIDYRGSAGYGRDWRTGIYETMGGKDLSDQVDGVKYLVNNYAVDPQKIGIYGGSYGGFITLMAMFTQPDVFSAGAALRSVTDWAHYNHGYTSDILNTPVTDSLAYVRSSPIYYADGLKGHLLMCHGMVDDNVHFQDIVRLSQRLIELKKENWELAVYPVESHGFVEPSSWIDEYSRIFKLFQENINRE